MLTRFNDTRMKYRNHRPRPSLSKQKHCLTRKRQRQARLRQALRRQRRLRPASPRRELPCRPNRL